MPDRTLLRARSLAARHPWAADLLLAAAVAAVSIAMVLIGPGPHKEARPPTLADAVAALVAFVLIALRRRWPLMILAAATVGGLWTMIRGGPTPVLLVAAWISACTVAYETDRRTGWLAGAAAAVVLYLGGAFFSDNGWAEPENIGVWAWTFMAVAIGDGLRTRRSYVAAIEERARRAEQSRDEEARRRVVEERLRIARELHDVVAHHIALINVQAGVASHVLRQQPEQAEEALGHVRKAARTVLDEISTLLGVLRREDEPEDSEPTRGLARLGGLLDSLAAAGMRVEHQQEGDARDLPAAIDLAAYRIVQESLTNAQKHGGDATAHLRLSYAPEGVAITVWNTAAGGDGNGTGHGLVGMRERAAAVGGTLQTVRDGGRFVVEAFLPSVAARV